MILVSILIIVTSLVPYQISHFIVTDCLLHVESKYFQLLLPIPGTVSLPQHVTSASSLSVLRVRLETYFFSVIPCTMVQCPHSDCLRRVGQDTPFLPFSLPCPFISSSFALFRSTFRQSRCNEAGLKCPSVRVCAYVRTSVRPQKVHSISMKFDM